jgi:hypothetical protein
MATLEVMDIFLSDYKKKCSDYEAGSGKENWACSRRETV